MARIDALGATLVHHYGVAARRPRRDRDAELPGVGDRVRGDHVDRRDLGFDERVVDAGGDGVRAARLGQSRGDRRCGAHRALRRSARSARTPARSRFARRGRCPRAPNTTRKWSCPAGRCPRSTSQPDMDATILYTSGTTGHPKGAVSTHRAVLTALASFSCRAAVNSALGVGPRKPQTVPTSFILIVPLFHVTGCVAVMLSCFGGGAKLVFMHKWNAARALELIEREQVTQLRRRPDAVLGSARVPGLRHARHLDAWLSVGGGGAPAPPELVRRVDKSFASARPGIGYGMTETNAYGPGNTGDDYLRKPTSCGRVLPSVELRVTDDAGNVLGPNEVGEIWFRGAEPDPRLLEPARGHRRDDRRRLAAQRRHRPHRRRGLRLRAGPRQGHGAARRRERVLRRGRSGDLRAPGRVRGRRLRRAARAARRGSRRGDRAETGSHASTRPCCARSSPSISRRSRSRPGSRCTPSSCRAIRPGRS